MIEFKIEVSPLGFGTALEDYVFLEDDWSDEAKRITIERAFAEIERQLLHALKL